MNLKLEHKAKGKLMARVNVLSEYPIVVESIGFLSSVD